MRKNTVAHSQLWKVLFFLQELTFWHEYYSKIVNFSSSAVLSPLHHINRIEISELVILMLFPALLNCVPGFLEGDPGFSYIPKVNHEPSVVENGRSSVELTPSVNV